MLSISVNVIAEFGHILKNDAWHSHARYAADNTARHLSTVNLLGALSADFKYVKLMSFNCSVLFQSKR